MGEKWPQVSLNPALRLIQTENSLRQLLPTLFTVHAAMDRGTEFLGRDDRHYVNIHDNIQRFMSFLHLQSRVGLYSDGFLWKGEREQVHLDGAGQTRDRGGFGIKGNLGQGRNRFSGCEPSLSPLQADFPLPYFLVLNSPPACPPSPPKKQKKDKKTSHTESTTI